MEWNHASLGRVVRRDPVIREEDSKQLVISAREPEEIAHALQVRHTVILRMIDEPFNERVRVLQRSTGAC